MQVTEPLMQAEQDDGSVKPTNASLSLAYWGPPSCPGCTDGDGSSPGNVLVSLLNLALENVKE